MISQNILSQLYLEEKKSVSAIASLLECSEHKINYWLSKYRIPKRSISEAIYTKHNPNGDPFKQIKLATPEDFILFGLGLGLYWGEGNKKNKNAVRLGNTDPQLIKKFLQFLKNIFQIDSKKLRFGLQVFNDMDSNKALAFWQRELDVSPSQFYKVINTPSGSIGTYREKSKYGVLAIYYCNTKLRNIICQFIKDM